MPRNEPLSLELPAALVDLLADYVRTDGESMREAVALSASGEPARYGALELARVTLAQTIVEDLLKALPAFSAEGDFADALNERDEIYDEYRRRKAPASN